MKTRIILPALIAAGLLGSCSEERTLPVGDATMLVSASVNSDVKVVSRAAGEESLTESTVIWISNGQGVVRKYEGMAQLPADGIKLVSGDYKVQAWAGKAEYASFTSRWFEGEENVTLAAGDVKQVQVECKIANIVASVNVSDEAAAAISDVSLTVGHSKGTLAFEGTDDARKAYFLMPDGDTSLSYVLTATAKGRPFEVRGTIADVKPAHEYVINVNRTEGESGPTTDGAAFISIEVDDHMVEVADKVILTEAPAITGFEFDITQPQAGSSGAFDDKSVFVCSANAFQSVQLSGVEGRGTVNLLTSDALASAGITRRIETYDNGSQLMEIVFSAAYLNTLQNRTEPYVYTITAKDKSGKESSAELKISVSDASIISSAATAVTCSGATLNGRIVKDGLTNLCFQYRLKGADSWQTVKATVSGKNLSATLTRLNIAADYEFRAVCDQAQAGTLSFTTKTPPQPANAGMEDWYQDGTPYIPAADAASQMWDSGNHGSATMRKNVTTPSDLRHSGNRSAALSSQFVGIGTIGKFAAGNIFYGKYLATDGMDGVLGFGRPFEVPADLKVKALKVWVKYNPATVNYASSYISQGAQDQGMIYIALFDDTDKSDSDANYNGVYGRVIRTKSQQLFSKDLPNVCAYGERVFDGATSGDDLVEVTIPVSYVGGKGEPKLLLICCTASRFGDYFSGGAGSTMYVDDFQLIYEPK